MMKLKVINLFTIFEIYSLIGPTLSSTFLSHGNKSPYAEYTRLRETSVYRGMLLSLSPEQKHEICEDIYSAQLYADPKTKYQADTSHNNLSISDSFSSQESGQRMDYKLYIRYIAADRLPETEVKEDLVMRCFGTKFTWRSHPENMWYHVTYAFQTKWLYSGLRQQEDKRLTFLNFITLSPDYVPIEQAELETYYMNMRRIIEALSDESQEYVDQIKNQDLLSTLSDEQKYILCASILSSPIYRSERLEFSMKWKEENKETMEYVSKYLSFKNPNYPEKSLKADCILCKAFKNGGRRNYYPKNLYLTSSFDDEHSVIVLKEEDNRSYVDKHFKNIPILMILQKEMDYDRLVLNFVEEFLPPKLKLK